MTYCIDTSALMDAWVRWYPLENFPSLWENLDILTNSGQLISSEEVYRKLEKNMMAYSSGQKKENIFLYL